MLEQQLDTLRRSIAARDQGEFCFPDIYGEGWDDLYIGDKVKFGREFLARVRNGDFKNVEDTGRKNSGGRIYRKIQA